jgi:hypothetical protein
MLQFLQQIKKRESIIVKTGDNMYDVAVIEIKDKKRVLQEGGNRFNTKAKDGIAYLQGFSSFNLLIHYIL